MNREDILHMIDTITHPVNMKDHEAVQFLVSIKEGIDTRIEQLCLEALDRNRKS